MRLAITCVQECSYVYLHRFSERNKTDSAWIGSLNKSYLFHLLSGKATFWSD